MLARIGALATAFVWIWIAGLSILFAFGGGASLAKGDMHLGIGALQVSGREAACLSLVIGLLGLATLVLLGLRRKWGNLMLLAYSVLLAVPFSIGFVQDIVAQARHSSMNLGSNDLIPDLAFFAGYCFCVVWAWRRVLPQVTSQRRD